MAEAEAEAELEVAAAEEVALADSPAVVVLAGSPRAAEEVVVADCWCRADAGAAEAAEVVAAA